MFSPEKTSIRQVASGIRKGIKYGYIRSGMFVVDYGGGRFNDGVEFLARHGVKCVVYDPHARSMEENLAVITDVSCRGGADCVMLNNVLNVIPDPLARRHAIQSAWGMTRKGGTLLITVYRGDSSGVGSRRDFSDGSWTWQENRLIRDYFKEVVDALPDDVSVDVKYGMMVVR